jgi:hypothetical protein
MNYHWLGLHYAHTCCGVTRLQPLEELNDATHLKLTHAAGFVPWSPHIKSKRLTYQKGGSRGKQGKTLLLLITSWYAQSYPKCHLLTVWREYYVMLFS